MAQEQENLPSFKSPPVIETILGVQFAPISKLTGAHVGWFWKTFLDSAWTIVREVPFLPDQFERFEPESAWRLPSLQWTESIPNRLQIVHEDDDRVIQIQTTRLLCNWRKRAEAYPRFQRINPEFQNILSVFRAFLKNANLGDIVPNQWEVTYVNHIPQGDLWHSTNDWPKILPGLFSSPYLPAQIRFESLSGDWHFELMPRMGRLHISCKHGRVENGKGELMVLELTARGPLDGVDTNETIQAGLKLGRRAIVEAFVGLASESARTYWGIESC